jgi:hypothetical protein
VELNKLLEAIGRELKDTTTAAEIGYLPSEGMERKDNKLTYTSHNGRIKIKQLDKDQWEVEFDGKVQKGSFKTIMERVVEVSKSV